MQKDAQVGPVDLELLADPVLVFLFEKHAPQQLAVFLRQSVEGLPDCGLGFLGEHQDFRTGGRVGCLGSVLGNLAVARGLPDEFERDIVAHGVHKSRQAGRVLQRLSRTEVRQNPKERLLRGILNQFGRA